MRGKARKRWRGRHTFCARKDCGRQRARGRCRTHRVKVCERLVAKRNVVAGRNGAADDMAGTRAHKRHGAVGLHAVAALVKPRPHQRAKPRQRRQKLVALRRRKERTWGGRARREGGGGWEKAALRACCVRSARAAPLTAVYSFAFSSSLSVAPFASTSSQMFGSRDCGGACVGRSRRLENKQTARHRRARPLREGARGATRRTA